MLSWLSYSKQIVLLAEGLTHPMPIQENGVVQQGLVPEAPSPPNGRVKLEDAERASVQGDASEQNGPGRKRQRAGKDRKAVQPVRSYPTRERAKAEAEVVAEVCPATTCCVAGRRWKVALFSVCFMS